MNKKPIAFVGTSILLFSNLLPTGVVFAESIGLEQKSEQTEQSDKTLESVQSDVTIPEKSEVPPATTEASTEEQTTESSATETSEEAEEAVVPAMVLKRKNNKAIKEGQTFDLEIFGNLAESVLALPEGLAFDAEDNLSGDKPNEDFSWNEEKRELTIKNISEEEASANVVTLTAEKAGSYELALFDEETNYQGEKLAFDVEEKEEANKDTEESKEATTESSKEEKAAAKVKATPRAASIGVGISAAGSFRTYTDPVSGLAPTEYAVAVPLSISTAGITGAKVEIPYGFTPDPSNPLFKHFTMTDPIFSFIDPGTPAADSIVDHYENDTTNQKLIIHLKETKTTVETVNLRFKFNPDYDAKIPADQVIWENLQATAYDSSDVQLSQSGKVQVKASTTDGIYTTATRFYPTTEEYLSGSISVRLRLYNNHNKRSLLDETADNRAYVEYPTGSTVSANVTSYFTGPAKTNSDDPDIPVGYTRHYRTFSDKSTDFSNWYHDGNVNTNFQSMDSTFLPPSSLNEGESFHITIGAIYTKINGEEQTKESKLDYIKKVQPDWQLTPPTGSHSTGSSSLSTVNLSDPTASSAANYVFGYSSYYHTWTGKNSGKRNIKNTSFELYQKSTDSKKINFNSIFVYNIGETGSTLGHYKVEFSIVNASDSTSRSETSAIYSTNKTIPLPSLGAQEYIDKVTVIPMGLDGTAEGDWVPDTGFAIRYTAKNWDSGKWPDGTTIPTNEISKVEMGGTLYYDDETNDQPAVAATQEMDTGFVYYAPGTTTDTYANFVSSNANSRKPGDTVDYEIQGYNLTNAVSSVSNPEVTVAIPKVLEMQNPGTAKDFYDEKNGTNYPGAVAVNLIGSDSTNNYYRFKATGVAGYNNQAGLSYKIPVSFKVASGTPVGTYTIPATTVTNEDFVQILQETNNLPDALATSMGYDNTVPQSYTGRTSGHTALSIVFASKLNGDTAGRKDSGDGWTETTHFAVDKNGTPQMKATVSNTGNTSFDNVRLYDILPSSLDGRGSTGNINFTGLDNAGGTVYYTTKAISTLPDYSSDLQKWDAAKLTSYGFSTTPPSDMKDVTAIFIDFGAQVVAPNQSLDTVMNFLVPNADNQKAVNQFQYSAKEVGSNTTLNAKSSEILFSTEVATVAYDENLPSFMAPGETQASNMPDDQAVLLDISGKGSITLSNKKPTMTGYSFLKWQDKANASKEYDPGDTINFTSTMTELNLKAIWKAVSVNVTYKKNDGTTANADVKTYEFGDTVSLAAVTEPTRTGYQFKGWGTTTNATVADFTEGTPIDFVTNKTVYAIWEANTYSVEFKENGGTGTMTDQSFTYDTAGNLKANTFTRAGYQFKGWAKASNAVSADYADKASVKNLSSVANGKVTLHAVWEALDQTINFDVNGGDISSKPDDIVKKTDQDVEIDKVKAPTRTGYTFEGWYNGAAKVTGTIKMPAGGMTLTAHWKANKYTVEFNANKGTGSMAPQQFTYDANQTLTANSFTRSGYTFVGWATSDTGSSAYVDQQNVKNLTAVNNGKIELFAVWSASPQVLQFDVNGGDVSSKPANINSTTDATVDISGVNAPTRTGYKFTGWYDGSTKVGNSIVMPVGGKTLRAEWEAISYKVNFHANTGSGSMAKQTFVYDVDQPLTKNTYTKAGYQFEGWKTAQNGLTCDYLDEQTVKNLCTTHDDELTVYAVWRALDQTVTFDVNGGDPATQPLDIIQPTDSTVDLTTVQAPTRTGYKFAGWYDGINKENNSFVMPAGGKTLRAEWTPIKYSVTFDKTSGTGSMTDQEFEYDLNQGLSKNEFSKEGYSFTGWSTVKDSLIDFADEEAVQNLTDVDGAKITLYANWKADDQTLRFDVNGGDEATKPADIISPTDSTVDLTKVKAPTRTGYQFSGWYDGADKAGDDLVMPAGGKTLVAKWTPIKYSVQFDGNSGTGTMAAQGFEYDAEQKLSKNTFTKAGYSFTGWSQKKDGEVEYTDEKAVNNLTTTDGEKITLFAIWQAEDQVVKFDVNGGDEATKPADITGKTGEKVDISKVKAPTRSGYTFAGWYVKDKKSEDVFEMPVGGLTLVAKWTKNDEAAGGSKSDDKNNDSTLPKTEGSYRSYFGARYFSKKAGDDSGYVKNLPKTGSERNPIAGLLGLCILAGSSFMLWIRRSKKE
ncbi:InlB B-repeat-containing protein [Enterococcus gilvus]|uniref:InlB B-repeat-containing protein n=1 Tax=Enterococcus gilvus TaxID=160453 RepID=UPI001C8CC929|nr:InlB B-repeat-containing protein [Enterococcus gilvus]MBX8935984.1 LPXTG cell wall anchor domain-containing protein [Enterococcus gilvus]